MAYLHERQKAEEEFVELNELGYELREPEYPAPREFAGRALFNVLRDLGIQVGHRRRLALPRLGFPEGPAAPPAAAALDPRHSDAFPHPPLADHALPAGEPGHAKSRRAAGPQVHQG